MKAPAMKDYRVLAVAVATGRVGSVFLMGDRLMDWRISRKASQSTTNAVEVAQKWINELRPNVVITENTACALHKGEQAKNITAAIARIAAHNYVLDISIERVQHYANKYEEATALTDHYPELLPWLPKKRRFFDNEPRETVLFEALALAMVVIKNPTKELAAGMG